MIWYQREQQTFAAIARGSYQGVSFQAVDPGLCKHLQDLLERRPTLNDVKSKEIIGDASAVEFYDRPIARSRDGWFDDAVAHVLDAGSHMIFLDPDTGVATDNEAKAKHAKAAELQKLMERGCCVATIHFPGRGKRTIPQTRTLLDGLAAQLHRPQVFVLSFAYQNGRFFFIAPCDAHDGDLRTRADSLISDWQPLFGYA